MPLFDGTDIHMILPPVLQTSLPEGELLAAIYQKMGKVLKISDDFDILKLVGGNMIGRIVCVPPECSPRKPGPFIEYDRLMTLLHTPEPQTLLTQSMIELSEKTGISGVLPKVFGMSDFRMTLPSDRYIVKSENREFPGICAVEHLCMTACMNSEPPPPVQFFLKTDKPSLLRCTMSSPQRPSCQATPRHWHIGGKGNASRPKGSSSLPLPNTRHRTGRPARSFRKA